MLMFMENEVGERLSSNHDKKKVDMRWRKWEGDEYK